jgi:hypothetical protein
MGPRALIASRIDQGVDVQRALSDARYARDMRLVRDAMRGTRQLSL